VVSGGGLARELGVIDPALLPLRAAAIDGAGDGLIIRFRAQQ
jgi:hypothetical protein